MSKDSINELSDDKINLLAPLPLAGGKREMLTEDYLMRYIRIVVAALQRALGFRNAGLYQDALWAVDQILAQLVNIPTDLFRQMDDDSILNMFTQTNGLDVERIQWIADLTLEEAAIYAAMKSPAESLWRMLRALNFYLVVALNEENSRIPAPHEAIRAIVSQISDTQLTPDIQLSLYQYYERQGDYYLADRIITQLISRPDAPSALREIALEFYRRLQDVPPDELGKGGIDLMYIQKRIEEISSEK